MKQLSMAILISNDAYIFTTLGCLMTGTRALWNESCYPNQFLQNHYYNKYCPILNKNSPLKKFLKFSAGVFHICVSIKERRGVILGSILFQIL